MIKKPNPIPDPGGSADLHWLMTSSIEIKSFSLFQWMLSQKEK